MNYETNICIRRAAQCCSYTVLYGMSLRQAFFSSIILNVKKKSLENSYEIAFSKHIMTRLIIGKRTALGTCDGVMKRKFLTCLLGVVKRVQYVKLRYIDRPYFLILYIISEVVRLTFVYLEA